MQKSTTKSFTQTQKLGEKLAKEILNSELGDSAVVLGLQGELGTGKTTFLQGFAKGLGIEEKILSPTFILMKKFKIPKKVYKTDYFSNRRSSTIKVITSQYFYHIDCYRLKNEEDLEVLGFEEIILNPQNIVAIEWPEKIKSFLPKNTILIKFEHSGGDERKIMIGKFLNE